MSRVNLAVKYPPEPNESGVDYTKRLLSHAREAGTFRQCSIGYHEECSDQYGDECNCSCHAVGVLLTRDQLESWAQRELSDEEVETLDTVLSTQSLPELVRDIVAGWN